MYARHVGYGMRACLRIGRARENPTGFSNQESTNRDGVSLTLQRARGQTDQCVPKAGIPPGKSDASGGIGPRPTVTSTLGFSARCRPMRPIFLVEFQLNMGCASGRTRVLHHYGNVSQSPDVAG